MANDFDKVIDGQPLAIPAQAYNSFIDAALDFRKRAANIGGNSEGASRDTNTVLIRNDTGDDLEAFEAVALGDAFILPTDELEEFQQIPNLIGLTPVDPDDVGYFAILQEPLPKDSIGIGLLVGVTPTKLNVTAESDTHADIADGEYQLKTGTTGLATILYKQSGTGADKWAYVRIGGGSAGGTTGSAALVTITSATVTSGTQPGTIVKGGSGSCVVQNYVAGQSAMVNGRTYYAVRDGVSGGLPLYWTSLRDC